MIPLIAGQSEEPLFENRIAAVPESQREAQPLVVIADSRDAVLAPAIGAHVRMLEGEKLPRGAAFAVVFTNGPPLALRQIRTPAPPMLFPSPGFVQAPLLGFHELLDSSGMPPSAE